MVATHFCHSGGNELADSQFLFLLNDNYGLNDNRQ
jgi:hypothetical protein